MQVERENCSSLEALLTTFPPSSVVVRSEPKVMYSLASLSSTTFHGLHSQPSILSHFVPLSCIPDRHESPLPPLPPFLCVRVMLFQIPLLYIWLDVELMLHPSTCNAEVVCKMQELLGTPRIIVCSNGTIKSLRFENAAELPKEVGSIIP